MWLINSVCQWNTLLVLFMLLPLHCSLRLFLMYLQLTVHVFATDRSCPCNWSSMPLQLIVHVFATDRSCPCNCSSMPLQLIVHALATDRIILALDRPSYSHVFVVAVRASLNLIFWQWWSLFLCCVFSRLRVGLRTDIILLCLVFFGCLLEAVHLIGCLCCLS